MTNQIARRQVLADWMVTMGAEAVTACANLAAGILLARAVGADGKGVFALTMTVAAIAAAVFGLRWERASGHLLARDVTAMPTILTSLPAVAAIAMALTVISFWLCPPRLLELIFRGVDARILTLVAWLVGAQCLYVGIAAIYGGLRDFGTRSKLLLTFNLFQMLWVSGLYVVGVRDVVTYLWWYVTISWAIEGLWFTGFVVRRRVFARWDWPLIRGMVTFGSLSYVSVLLDLVTIRLDIILLSVMASTSAAGIYAVTVAIGARLASIPQIVGYVVFHRTSAQELGTGHGTAQIVRLAILTLAGGGVVAATVGSMLLGPLYGPAFAAGVPALWIVIPAMGVWGLYRLLASDVEGRGRPGLVSLSSLAGNVTIVILDIRWIPEFGILGAAWASLIAYSVALGMMAITFCSVTGLSFRDAYSYRPDDLAVMLRITSRLARGAGLAGQPG